MVSRWLVQVLNPPQKFSFLRKVRLIMRLLVAFLAHNRSLWLWCNGTLVDIQCCILKCRTISDSTQGIIMVSICCDCCTIKQVGLEVRLFGQNRIKWLIFKSWYCGKLAHCNKRDETLLPLIRCVNHKLLIRLFVLHSDREWSHYDRVSESTLFIGVI
jgi:hypothetical protein